jgi:plastocyanin
MTTPFGNAAQSTGRLARWRIAACLALAAAAPGAMLAWAAETHEIVQKNRMFQAREIEVARGDVVRFTNADEFLHQIYVKSPDFSFESDEQVPGKTIDLKFPAGTFEVRCRIHPKMLLVVHAK